MHRLSFLILLLSVCALSLADDGDIEGIGGNIKLMKGHKSIRMVSEYVHIKLPEGTVRAVFIFRNDGPATTVKMGFPETGSNPSPKKGDRTLFGYFRSYVDGQRFKVKREGSLDRDTDGGYQVWWTKSVHFGRNQTRVVVNEYQGGLGGDTSNTAYFSYVLATGASWKGNIGRAKLVVDVTGLGKVSELKVSPNGFKLRGHVFTWDLRNLEPTEDDDISLTWWDGFKGIYVNGASIEDTGYRYDPNLTKGNEPPRSDGKDVVLPVRAAAAFLDCDLKVVDSRTVEIQGPTRSARISSGSRRITSGRRVFMLRRPVWTNRNYWGASKMVELRPLVAALGGKSWWDKKGHLQIKMPD